MKHRSSFLFGVVACVVISTPMNAQNRYGLPLPQLVGQYVCTGTQLAAMSRPTNDISPQDAAKHNRPVNTPVKIVTARIFGQNYFIQIEGDALVYRVNAPHVTDFAADQPCTAQGSAARPQLPKSTLSGVVAAIDNTTVRVVTKEGRSVTMTFESDANITRTGSGNNTGKIAQTEIHIGDTVGAFGSFSDATHASFVAVNASFMRSPEEAAAAASSRQAPTTAKADPPLITALSKAVTPEDSPAKVADQYWKTVIQECKDDSQQNSKPRFFYSERVGTKRGPYATVTDWTLTELQGPFAHEHATRELTPAEKANSGGDGWIYSETLRPTIYRFL